MDNVKKTKKSKKDADALAETIPPHILNIMRGVDSKAKGRKKEHELKKQQSMDSIALIRTMMSSVRTKYELSEAADEVRKDKEMDSKMISNARDIFKHLECQDEENPPERASKEKVKRVEVKPDFLLDGQNKADEIRKERLKEMEAMRIARERQLEEEERSRFDNKNRGDELRKQREREMDIMRMARQQALEEEERVQSEQSRRGVREISPGLLAARQGFRLENREEENRVERMRLERERELAEMRRARAIQMEHDQEEIGFKAEKSEAARELEAFRAVQAQGLRNRFPQGQQVPQGQESSQRQDLRKAPRSKRIADNWMRREEEDKVEEMRRARELELEMMLNARNIAFEEEEEERMAMEAMRREEAERKGREMAVLVAELQRMRSETERDGHQDERMTRYQEEMMQRVMELHAIASAGLISN